jgi:hypothetical protein
VSVCTCEEQPAPALAVAEGQTCVGGGAKFCHEPGELHVRLRRRCRRTHPLAKVAVYAAVSKPGGGLGHITAVAAAGLGLGDGCMGSCSTVATRYHRNRVERETEHDGWWSVGLTKARVNQADPPAPAKPPGRAQQGARTRLQGYSLVGPSTHLLLQGGAFDFKQLQRPLHHLASMHGEPAATHKLSGFISASHLAARARRTHRELAGNFNKR